MLSLASTGQTRLPALELLLGARVGKFPVAPQPRYDPGAAAEHRMNLAVRHLTAIGCRASGFISDEEDLVRAVLREIRSRDYTAVLLVTGMHHGSWLARRLRLDPAHRIQWRLGRRLVVVPLGAGAPHPALPGSR